jgi:hypothetical protein
MDGEDFENVFCVILNIYSSFCLFIASSTRTLPKLIVSFSVLFVCKCVLYYCHRVATQLQLTNISVYQRAHAKLNNRYTQQKGLYYFELQIHIVRYTRVGLST